MNEALRSRMLVLFLASIVVTPALSPVYGEKSPQKLWSTDWEPFWPRELSGVTQSCFPPTVKIASSATVVAVGVDRSCEPSSTRGTLSPIQRPHWLIVFFLDGSSGRLLAKREPQLAEFNFDLYATSEGRFLVHLRNVSNLGAKQVESLILMSPDGKTLKSLELQPAEGDLHPRVWKTFISPSRKTLLATQVISRTARYRVFEADTVAMRAEWVSLDPAEPIALSVSDKEVLGLPHPMESGRPASGLQQYPQVSIRMFDGAWRSLLPPSNENLRRSFYAFLNDDAITILDNGNLQSGDSFADLRVVQTSGQTEGPEVFKKSSWSNIWAGPRIETSIDGHYFATSVSSTSRFWETLDVYPTHTELYVWNRRNLTPILRIKITSSRLSFCFLPEGSRLIVLDGKILKTYGLP